MQTLAERVVFAWETVLSGSACRQEIEGGLTVLVVVAHVCSVVVVVVVGELDSLLSDLNVPVVVMMMAGDIDSSLGYVDLLTVAGLDTGSVFALSDVNWRLVMMVVGVDLNTRVGVGSLGSTQDWLGQLKSF